MPQPFFCDKRTSHKHAGSGEAVFRRSSDSCHRRRLLSFIIHSAFPELLPVTGFHQECIFLHIQRRYRSGFAPDYLVQQRLPYAKSATEKVSSCRKYDNTRTRDCQISVCTTGTISDVIPSQCAHWRGNLKHYPGDCHVASLLAMTTKMVHIVRQTEIYRCSRIWEQTFFAKIRKPSSLGCRYKSA